MIGCIKARSGSGRKLASVLVEGSVGMPGCLSYVVSSDCNDPDTIWVVEIWRDKDAHVESLALPGTKAAIERGRSLIAQFVQRVELNPVGWNGAQAPPVAGS